MKFLNHNEPPVQARLSDAVEASDACTQFTTYSCPLVVSRYPTDRIIRYQQGYIEKAGDKLCLILLS
jgi:hypothetical protein